MAVVNKSQVSEPGSAAIVKETAYPLHLSRREPISFAYHKALILSLANFEWAHRSRGMRNIGSFSTIS
jgi:hypothetical protein